MNNTAYCTQHFLEIYFYIISFEFSKHEITIKEIVSYKTIK